MQLGVEVRGGADQDVDILACAADERVAEMAEKTAYLTGLVVVIDDEFLIIGATDSTLATLPSKHLFVIRKRDTVLGFQVYTSRLLRI